MRTLLLASLMLLQCGEETSPPASSAPPPAAPSAPAPVEDEPAAAPAPTASESCEGLVRPCGGWEGCIHVREILAAGDGPAMYEGLDAVSGHTYQRDERCVEGVCNDMCDPSSGACRHGLTENLPTVCSRASGPSRAPFFCELVAGACIQHDLPPPTATAGPRS